MSIFDQPTNSRRRTEPPRVRWFDYPDPNGPTMEQSMSRAYDNFMAMDEAAAQGSQAGQGNASGVGPYQQDQYLPPKPPIVPELASPQAPPAPGPNGNREPLIPTVLPSDQLGPNPFLRPWSPKVDPTTLFPNAQDPIQALKDQLGEMGLRNPEAFSPEELVGVYRSLIEIPYVESDPISVMQRVFSLVSGAVARKNDEKFRDRISKSQPCCGIRG